MVLTYLMHIKMENLRCSPDSALFSLVFFLFIWRVTASSCEPTCSCQGSSSPEQVYGGKCVCPGIGKIPHPYQEVLQLQLEFSKRVILDEDCLPSFPKLEVLELSGLQYVNPGGFKGLENLKKLVFHRNFMRVFDSGMFMHLEKLQRLIAETNGSKVHTLAQGTFTNLTSLTHLTLKGNSIWDIWTETFRGLGKLSELDLSGNRLFLIKARTFGYFTVLQELILSNNKINYIERHAFDNLNNLQNLHLEDNLITIMPEPKIRPPLDNFHRVTVWLHGNPIQCDCHLNWIYTWVKVDGKHCEGTCQSPITLQNKSLSDVYKESLTQCHPNNSKITAQEEERSELTCPIIDAAWTTPEGNVFQKHGECKDPFYLTNAGSLVIWKMTAEREGIYRCASADNEEQYMYQVGMQVFPHSTGLTIGLWAVIAVATASVFVITVVCVVIIIRCRRRRPVYQNLPGEPENAAAPRPPASEAGNSIHSSEFLINHINKNNSLDQFT